MFLKQVDYLTEFPCPFQNNCQCRWSIDWAIYPSFSIDYLWALVEWWLWPHLPTQRTNRFSKNLIFKFIYLLVNQQLITKPIAGWATRIRRKISWGNWHVLQRKINESSIHLLHLVHSLIVTISCQGHNTLKIIDLIQIEKTPVP